MSMYPTFTTTNTAFNAEEVMQFMRRYNGRRGFTIEVWFPENEPGYQEVDFNEGVRFRSAPPIIEQFRAMMVAHPGSTFEVRQN